jgi:Tfp pilus assembly protein PilF
MSVMKKKDLLSIGTPSLKLAVEDMILIHGEQHILVARALNDLAEHYYKLGSIPDLQESYSTFERSLKLQADLAGGVFSRGKYTWKTAIPPEEFIDTHYKLGKVIAAQNQVSVESKASKLHFTRTLTLREDYDTLKDQYQQQQQQQQQRELENEEELQRNPIECEEIVRHVVSDMDSTLIYADQAEEAMKKNELNEANFLFLKSIKLRRIKFGKSHAALNQVLLQYAELLKLRFAYKEAKQILDEALAISIESHGVENEESAMIMNNLGQIYRHLGKFGESETLLLESLEIRRKINGDYHTATASVLNNLAELHREKGEYYTAIQYHKSAIESFTHVVGEDHPGTINAKGNLGITLRRQSQVSLLEGELIVKETLQTLQAKSYNVNHPWMEKFSSENAITKAEYLHTQGKYDEAIQIYNDLLAQRHVINQIEIIREKKKNSTFKTSELMSPSELRTDDDDGNLMYVSQNLMVLFQGKLKNIIGKVTLMIKMSGLYEEADQILEENLIQSKDILGDKHQLYFEGIKLSIDIKIFLSQYDIASELLRRMLQIWSDICGPEHIDVVYLAALLAEVYFYQGLYHPSSELYIQVMEIISSKLSLDPLSGKKAGSVLNFLYVKVLLGQTRLYLEAFQITKCTELLIQSKKILDDNEDFMDNLSIDYYIINGNIQRLCGKYDKSERLYTLAIEKSIEVYNYSHPIVAIIMENLASIAFERGDLAKATAIITECGIHFTKCIKRKHVFMIICDLLKCKILVKIGDVETAQLSVEHCMMILTEYLGARHLYVADCMLLMADINDAKGNFCDSYSQLKVTLDIIRESRGQLEGIEYADLEVGLSLHPSICQVMVKVGLNLVERGLINEASNIISEAKINSDKACDELLVFSNRCNGQDLLDLVANEWVDKGVNNESTSEFIVRNDREESIISSERIFKNMIHAFIDRTFAIRQCSEHLLEDAYLAHVNAGYLFANVGGINCIEVANSLVYLADVSCLQGLNRLAHIQYSHALSIYLEQVGHKHFFIDRIILKSLNNLYYVGYSEDVQNVLKTLKHKLDVSESSVMVEIDHDLILGKIKYDEGDYARAEELFRESLDLVIEKLDQKSLKHGILLNHIAQCLIKQNRFEEVERLLDTSNKLIRRPIESQESINTNLGLVDGISSDNDGYDNTKSPSSSILLKLEITDDFSIHLIDLMMTYISFRNPHKRAGKINDEVIRILESQVLPFAEKNLTINHPQVAYVKGMIGAHQAIGKKSSSDDTLQSALNFLYNYGSSSVNKFSFTSNAKFVRELVNFNDTQQRDNLSSILTQKREIVNLAGNHPITLWMLPDKIDMNITQKEEYSDSFLMKETPEYGDNNNDEAACGSFSKQMLNLCESQDWGNFVNAKSRSDLTNELGGHDSINSLTDYSSESNGKTARLILSEEISPVLVLNKLQFYAKKITRVPSDKSFSNGSSSISNKSNGLNQRDELSLSKSVNKIKVKSDANEQRDDKNMNLHDASQAIEVANDYLANDITNVQSSSLDTLKESQINEDVLVLYEQKCGLEREIDRLLKLQHLEEENVKRIQHERLKESAMIDKTKLELKELFGEENLMSTIDNISALKTKFMPQKMADLNYKQSISTLVSNRVTEWLVSGSLSHYSQLMRLKKNEGTIEMDDDMTDTIERDVKIDILTHVHNSKDVQESTEKVFEEYNTDGDAMVTIEAADCIDKEQIGDVFEENQTLDVIGSQITGSGHDKNALEAASYLFKRGKQLYAEGWYSKSLSLFRNSLDICLCHLTESEDICIDIKLEIVQNLLKLMLLEDALTTASTCLETLVGIESKSKTTTQKIHRLGHLKSTILYNLCRFIDSVNEFETTVRSYQEASGLSKSDGEFGLLLCDYVFALLAVGKIHEAKMMSDKAFSTLSKAYGTSRVEIVEALSIRVIVLNSFGKYKDSNPLLQQAAALARRHLGDSHPRVAEMLLLNAETLMMQGQLEESEKLLMKAQEMALIYLDTGHFLLLKIEFYYFKLMHLKARFIESNEGLFVLTEKILVGGEGEREEAMKQIGYDSRNRDEESKSQVDNHQLFISNIYYTIALNFLSLKDVANCEKYMQMCERLSRSILQDGAAVTNDHTFLINLSILQIEIYESLGNYETCLSLIDPQMDKLKRILGKENHDYLRAQVLYARILANIDRVVESKAIYQRIIYENDYESSGPLQYTKALSDYRDCLRVCCKYDEAQIISEEILTTLKSYLYEDSLSSSMSGTSQNLLLIEAQENHLMLKSLKVIDDIILTEEYSDNNSDNTKGITDEKYLNQTDGGNNHADNVGVDAGHTYTSSQNGLDFDELKDNQEELLDDLVQYFGIDSALRNPLTLKLLGNMCIVESAKYRLLKQNEEQQEEDNNERDCSQHNQPEDPGEETHHDYPPFMDEKINEVREEVIGKERDHKSRHLLNELLVIIEEKKMTKSSLQQFIEERTNDMLDMIPQCILDLNVVVCFLLEIVGINKSHWLLKYYQKVQKKYKKAPGELDLSRKLIKEGDNYVQTAMYVAAQLKYDEALTLQIKCLGEFEASKSLDVANTLLAIATNLKLQCHFDLSRQFYRKFYSISCHLFGEKSENCAKGLYGLAEILRIKGQIEDAEVLYDKVLQIRKDLLYMPGRYENDGNPIFKDHIGLADSQWSLSTILILRGEIEEAKKHAYIGHNILLRLDDKNDKNAYNIQYHKNICDFKILLAEISIKSGEIVEATKIIEDCSECRQQLFIDDHPDKAIDLYFLSNIYFLEDKLQEARKLVGKAMRLRIKFFGRLNQNANKRFVDVKFDHFMDDIMESSSFPEINSIEKRLIIETGSVSGGVYDLVSNIVVQHFDNTSTSDVSDNIDESSFITIGNSGMMTDNCNKAESTFKQSKKHELQPIETTQYLASNELVANTLKIPRGIDGEKIPAFVFKGNIVSNHYLIAQALELRGLICLELSDFEEAKVMLNSSLNINKDLFGGKSIPTSRSIYTLATLHEKIGIQSDGLTLNVLALDIRRQFVTQNMEKNLLISESLLAVGRLQIELSRLTEGLAHIKQANDITLSIFGNGHYMTIYGHVFEAMSYFLLAEYEVALSMIRKCRDQFEQVHDSPHHLIAFCFYIEARIQLSFGKYDVAYNCCDQASHHYALIYNDSHISSLDLKVLQGIILISQCKFLEAKTLVETTNKIQRDILGNLNHRVGCSLSVLAQCFNGLGKFQFSNLLFCRSLEILQNTLCKDHIQIVTSLIFQARNSLDLANFSVSRKLCLEARGICFRLFGEQEDHPISTLVSSCLAELDLELANYDEALEVFNDLLEIRRKKLKQMHPEVANAIHQSATCLRMIGDYSSAISNYERALKMRKNVLQPNHPDIIDSTFCIGIMHVLRGNFEQASAIYERCLINQRKALGPHHPRVANILFRLGELSNLLGHFQLSRSYLIDSMIIMKGTYKSTNKIDSIDLENTHSDKKNMSNIKQSKENNQDEKSTMMKAEQQTINELECVHPALAKILIALAYNLHLRGKYQNPNLNRSTMKKKSFLIFNANNNIDESIDVIGDVSLKTINDSSNMEIMQNRNVRFENKEVIDNLFVDIETSLKEVDTQLISDTRYIDDVNFSEDFSRNRLEGPIIQKGETLSLIGKDEKMKQSYSNKSPEYDEFSNDGNDDLCYEDDSTKGENYEEYKYSIPLLEKCLEILLLCHRRSPKHPMILSAHYHLAMSLQGFGEYTIAHELHKNTLIERRRLLGDKNLDTIQSFIALAESLRSLSIIYPKAVKLNDEKGTKANFAKLRQYLGPSLIDHLSSVLEATANSNESGQASAGNLHNGTWTPTDTHELAIIRKNQIRTKRNKSSNNNNKNGNKSLLSVSASADNLHDGRQIQAEDERTKTTYRGGFMGYEYSPIKKLQRDSRSSTTSFTRPDLSKFDDPIWLHDNALTLIKELYGDNPVHPILMADVLHEQAELYRARKENDKAIELCEESLSLKRPILKGSHPSVANSLLCIADALRFENRYLKAEPLLLKALQIYENAYSHDNKVHPQIAACKCSLGMLHYCMGNYRDSHFYYVNSLKERENILGITHISTAQSMNNYGGLLHTAGNFDQALTFYSKSLKIKQITFGDMHSDCAGTLNNIALVLKAMNRYQDAMDNYQDAIKILKSNFGEMNTEVASTMNNMASLYVAMGNIKRAQDVYKDSLHIKKKIHGMDHVSVASTLNNLASLCFACGEKEESKDYYEESLRIRRNIYGDEHPIVAESLNNIALLLLSEGDLDNAETLFRKAIDIKEETFGPRHLSTASSLHNLAILLHKRQKFNEAQDIYTQVINIRTDCLGHDHPDTKTTQLNQNRLSIDKELATKTKGVNVMKDAASTEGLFPSIQH